MKRGTWCAVVLSLLVACTAAVESSPAGPNPTPNAIRSGPHAFVLTSAGGLGGGAGLAAVALPFSLAAYLFSSGDLTTVLVAEGACLGIGSGLGAYWTGRSLGQPARFLPALGLALLPPLGAGVVLHLTGRGGDISDPIVAACGAAAVLGSPLLAAVGAGVCRHAVENRTGSRLQFVPELGVARCCEERFTRLSPRVHARVGLTVAF